MRDMGLGIVIIIRLFGNEVDKGLLYLDEFEEFEELCDSEIFN